MRENDPRTHNGSPALSHPLAEARLRGAGAVACGYVAVAVGDGDAADLRLTCLESSDASASAALLRREDDDGAATTRATRPSSPRPK